MADQADELRALAKEAHRSGSGVRAANHNTRIIVVTSGKGGVGKTNIATSMGIAYAQMGKKVIVLDADLGLANVNVMMNILPQYNLYHVMRKQKKLSEIILDTDYGVKLIAGASGFSKIANMDEAERDSFISELYTLSSADIIIIDTSAGVSRNVIGFVAAADEVVIVTTSEPTAITDAYGMIKIIATEIDNIDLSLKMIVNRVGTALEGRRVSDRMTQIAAQFLNLKVEYLGFIYNDPQVVQAVLKQKPFLVFAPHSKAAGCLKHIVARLEKTEVRHGGGLPEFIRRMFGRS